MEIKTFMNKVNEIKTRSNIAYDLRKKQAKVLAKELKEDDKIEYMIYFLSGIRTQNYIVLSEDYLYIMKKHTVIFKANINDLLINVIEYEDSVVGRLIISANNQTLNLKIYNYEMKKLVSILKNNNKNFKFNKQYIEKTPDRPMSKISIFLRMLFVVFIFLSIISLILLLMLKLDLL